MELNLGDLVKIGSGLVALVTVITYIRVKLKTLEKKVATISDTVNKHSIILSEGDKAIHLLSHKLDNLVGHLDKTFYPKEEAANTFVKKEVFDLHLKQFEYKLDITNTKLTELLSMYKIKSDT